VEKLTPFDEIYKINLQKLLNIMWIWTANKFAKFHAKRLNRSENITKSFRGLLFFWNTLYNFGGGFPCCAMQCRFSFFMQAI